MLHIRGKDCVALEVKYHNRCYQKYTSFLKYHRDDPAEGETSVKQQPSLYNEGFNTFCEQFVKVNIIQEESIFYMTKVKEQFVKIVADVENADASNYKTSRLKQRMKERFPQLIFQAPKQRNKSEMVYSGCIQPSTMVENIPCIDISSADTSDEGEEHERFVPDTTYQSSIRLQEIYNVALTLRNELESKKPVNWYGTWPPVASDITMDSVKKLVSPILFNFIAWLLGFSDEPEQTDYVQIHQKEALKIFSICQDLVNVFSRGKLQTPKSLSLAIAVRQISGCSGLITLLNGLGHCVSLPSTMAYESALAQLTINTSNIIPKDFVAGKHITLVYDNIDFQEDAKKQTHVTNGMSVMFPLRFKTVSCFC